MIYTRRQMTCSRHNLCITDSVANIVYEFNQQRVWNTSAILLIPTKTRSTNGEGRNTKSYLYGTIYTDTTQGKTWNFTFFQWNELGPSPRVGSGNCDQNHGAMGGSRVAIAA